jgi:hypothetical protein
MDDAREAAQRERPQISLIEEENQWKEEAVQILKASEEAREAAQREQHALIEEENRHKEEAMAMERAEKEARQRKEALREEENRLKEEVMAKEAKERADKEAKEARKRENALKREARRRETEARMAQERAEREAREEAERVEREARQREAALKVMEEENRRREEAMAKEAKEKAAKEAREARKRQNALKREAKRRENEARIARERAEREAREEAERIERAAREEAERIEREAREEAERIEREAREEAERVEMEAREAERRRQLEIAAQREKEAAVVEQYAVVSGTSLVTCSAGLNIQHVIPGFELCRIVIKGLPRNAKREEIADIFIQRGFHSSEFFISQVKAVGKKQEVDVLADAEVGTVISLDSDGIDFRDEMLSFGVSDNASCNVLGAGQNTPFIIVSWRIPAETIVANYHSMKEAQRKVRELDKKIWKGRQINAKMNDPPRQGGFRNFVPESVKLFNCPPGSAVDEEFYHFVGSHDVRALKSSDASFDLQESFDLIREQIAHLRGVRINTYQILKRGDQVDGEVKVKVEFDDWEDANQAHLTIDKRRMGFASPFYHCWLPKQLQYKITIPRQQYDSQKKQWDSLTEKKGADDPYVQVRMGDRGGVFIEIVGKEKKTAGPLKVRVENMIAGDKLDPTFWHPSFATSKSKGFFDRIFAEKNVFVRGDFKTQSLKIYGESNAVEEVRQRIKEEVERLGQMESTRVLNREWVGFFVREGVGKLEELLGEENVRLDVQPRMCRITIKGGEEANHYLQRLIDQARAAGIVDSVVPGTGETEVCPVCYGDLSYPEQLGCGHSYCSGCLKHFLTSAVDNKTFPLICVGNEATCNIPVAIPFIRRFLPAQTFSNLVEAAFHAYLEQHQRELKYCTTPDCKQIYRRRTDKTALQCPACFSTICPSCDEEAHAGMTCQEQRIHRNPALQERLNEELAASSGYKRCPSCRAMIEKIEGCNHMTCRCGAHICWQCLNVFETAQETYNHLRAEHGGIYDEAPAAPAVIVEEDWDEAWDEDFLAGQVEALARIERERVAREEALRLPRVAPPVYPFANPYYPNAFDMIAQQARIREWQAGIEEERARRERERAAAEAEEQARRARAAAEEQARLVREAAEEQVQTRRARAAAELQRQYWDANLAEQTRPVRLAQEAARRQEEDRGWCILM